MLLFSFSCLSLCFHRVWERVAGVCFDFSVSGESCFDFSLVSRSSLTLSFCFVLAMTLVQIFEALGKMLQEKNKKTVIKKK